jgi:hypothetical protein
MLALTAMRAPFVLHLEGEGCSIKICSDAAQWISGLKSGPPTVLPCDPYEVKVPSDACLQCRAAVKLD